MAKQIKGQTPLAPTPEGERRKYALAIEEILDRTEAEMRRLDPLVWEGSWENWANWCDEESDKGYWPGVLGEYNEYAMWSAEEVFADWLKAYQ